MRAVIALLLLAGTANADELQARILCATETVNASNIMMLRQRGTTAQELQGIASSADPAAQALYLGMIQEAFQRPIRRSLQVQRDEAYRFGQEWGARCRARIGI